MHIEWVCGYGCGSEGWEIDIWSFRGQSCDCLQGVAAFEQVKENSSGIDSSSLPDGHDREIKDIHKWW